MEIIVAKSAGFCFGVNRAVSSVKRLLDEHINDIKTYGPIIHNQQVIDFFNEKGVKIINSPIEGDHGGHVVIRAHGVTPTVMENLGQSGYKIIDETCPYVKKIHKLANKKHNEGYRIFIIGAFDHPEVIGINGWCDNSATIIYSLEEVENLELSDEKACALAQTTITKEKWETITNALKHKFPNLIEYNTICSATSTRQNEAAEIASKVDMMIVIGGTQSSNTFKLYEICKKYCENTFQIETYSGLPLVDINKIKRIGITAGASTPDNVIEEVVLKMSELNTNEQELSFEEALEASLVTIHSGDVVKGTITAFNNAEIFVDLGFKSEGVIVVTEFSDDPDFKPENSLKIGDEVEVYVIRVNDGEGRVDLSKKKVESIKGFSKIEEAFENKTTLKAKVVEIVNGGVIAVANGTKIFVPASQISDRFVKDLKEFVKQEISVRIIELNQQKRKVVGSQKVVLLEEKSKNHEQVWSNIEVGMKYQGTVKSLMDFGAFVDIGGVDGLIHISEMSWNKIKHPSEVLKVGDSVEVTIKECNKEKNRISLSSKKIEDNPWHDAEKKYEVGSIVKGKVVRILPFGAFVELAGGVDGMVHISQISNMRIAKPSDVLSIGQEVEAKVIELNLEAKKISLSIKEVNPIDPIKKDADAPNAEELPTEHTEEMTNKISMPDDLLN